MGLGLISQSITKAYLNIIYTVVQKNVTLFISLWFLQTFTDFYNIWHMADMDVGNGWIHPWVGLGWAG